MSKKWITILLAAAMAFTMTSSAFAACKVTLLGPAATAFSFTDSTAAKTITDPVPLTPGDKVSLVTPNTGAAAGLAINSEGVAERVSDLLITDDTLGTNFCFSTGSTLTITLNGVLTLPTTPGSLSIPGNLDIYDSAGIGGLTVSSANVSQGFAANTTQSIITITIGQTGTVGNLTVGPAGAALRVKNLRINATTVQGTLPAAVGFVFTGPGNGAAPTAVSFTNAGGTTAGTATTVTGTIATSDATWTDLLGAKDTAITTVAGGITKGTGTQSSGKGLATQGLVGFKENFVGAFRLAGGTCNSTTASSDTCASQVANDIATVATSLTFSITSIPSGVTVTFPSTINTSAATGVAGNSMVWTSRTGSTLTNGGASGALTVTYDTTKSGATAAGVANTVETADNADAGTAIGTAAGTSNPNCSVVAGVLGSNNNSGAACDPNPKIGVVVGATSGAGTANLTYAFGRGDVGGSQFTGDDVAADTTVIPRYAGSKRLIVNAQPFFTIAPIRTTLLFPFVSTFGGFNTGLSIVNSCADAGAVGATSTCSTLGGVTYYFFGVDPTTKAAVTGSINTDLTLGGVSVASACRGFDSNGRIVAGTVTGCVVSAMLPLLPSKPAGFEGYVIAVTGFNFAHGFSAQFNAAGAPFGANPALVLLGNGSTGPRAGEALGN